MIHELTTPTPTATSAVTPAVPALTAANNRPAATPGAAATAPSIPASPAAKTIKPLGVKASLAAPTNPLMAQYVRDMQVAGLALSTQHTYLEAVQRFIQATWITPAAATEADFQSYLIALRSRDVAGQTFRVQRFALQLLFENTLRHDWPLFKKKLKSPIKRRLPQALSHEQVAALLSCVRDSGARACLTLMYSCGLRIAEATRLTVHNIDSKAMLIRVVGKGNKERLVPLSPGLLEQLRAHYKTHRHPLLVFPNRRGQHPLWPSQVEKTFQLALRAAGIKGHFTPHGLRHSFACRLLERKVPGETLRIVMGHATAEMTQRYLHLTEPVRRTLAEVVASLHIAPAQ